MRASTTGLWCGGLALLIAAAGPCNSAAAGDEGTVKAFAAWTARGATFQTGVHEATFVGSLAGPIFVETDKGMVNSGRLSCPAIVDIGLDDGKERGEGRCTITARDGAQIYAEITCTGVFMIGCHGDLKLTGGTERFAGITGTGKAMIRSDLQRFVPVSEGAAAQDGTGSLILTGLHYKIP